MADTKISALTSATVPLAGTEVLPIVQGGATVKVTVDNLTAGKAVSMSNLTYTGTLTGSTGIANIGAGQVYKDASGNVGVGTTAPFAKLNTAGATSTNATAYDSTSPPAAGQIDARSTDAYTTQLGGKVTFSGIAGTGAVALSVYGAVQGYKANASASQAGGGLILSSTSNASGLLTEGARIDDNQNLLVGTTVASPTSGVGIKNIYSATAPYISIVAAGSSAATNGLLIYSTGAAAYRFYVGMDGTINATSIVISAISDQRLKENVRDIDTGLNAILALKPRRFDWKEGKGQDKKNAAGFIAQEFENVFPESVGLSKASEDGIEYKNINHETLIPTLVKAIQEQQTIITALTTRITALESK